MDHKGEFTLLVMKRLGASAAEDIEWGSPRLLCIAGDFTKFDEHAVQQINRNIELIRYRRYGDFLLLLELVNASSADPVETPSVEGNGGKPNAAEMIRNTPKRFPNNARSCQTLNSQT